MIQARRPQRVLVAEPDPTISGTLREFLIHIGYEADTADNRADVLEKVSNDGYGVIVLDHLLNSSGDGDLLDDLRCMDPSICVIMLISFPLVEYVITAFRKGAVDVVVKPVDLFELDEIVKRAFSRYELNKVYRYVRDNRERIDELIQSGEVVAFDTTPITVS